jgi:hypothetical protein
MSSRARVAAIKKKLETPRCKARKSSPKLAKARQSSQKLAKGRKGTQRDAKGRKGTQRDAKGRKGEIKWSGGIHDLQSEIFNLQSRISHPTRARQRSGGSGVSCLGISKSRARHRGGKRSDVRWVAGGIVGLEGRGKDGGRNVKSSLKHVFCRNDGGEKAKSDCFCLS